MKNEDTLQMQQTNELLFKILQALKQSLVLKRVDYAWISMHHMSFDTTLAQIAAPPAVSQNFLGNARKDCAVSAW